MATKAKAKASKIKEAATKEINKKSDSYELDKGIIKIKSRFKEKFTPISNVKVSDIKIKPEIFQGRSVPFASETVAKIVREGFDKSQEPIVVWRDEAKNENIVISGHSRFEAAKELSKKGDKNLKTIPVKFFNGDFDDAVDYAVIESNRSGKTEGIESDIKAFMRATQRGYNKDFLLSIFKEDGYINTLRNLSNLDSRGEFIRILSQQSQKSFPYILRNAEWVGQLRREYPQLTNDHEREFFTFFYTTDKGLKIKKNVLFDNVKKKISRFDFDSKRKLNLTNIDEDKVKEDTPGKTLYNQIQSAIESFNRERINKEEMIVKAENEGKSDLIPKFEKRIEEINKVIIPKYRELYKLGGKLKEEDKRMKSTSFFGNY